MSEHSEARPGAGSDFSELIGAAGQRVQEVLEAAEKAADSILAEVEVEAKRRLDDAEERADRLTLQRVRKMAELTDGLLERADTVKQRSDDLAQALDAAIESLEHGLIAASAVADDDPSAEMPAEYAVAPDPERFVDEAPSATVDAPGGADDEEPAPAAEPQPAAGFDVSANGDSHSRRPGADQLAGRLERLRNRIGTASHARPPDRHEELIETPSNGSSEATESSAVSEGAQLLAAQMAVAGSSRAQIESRLRADFGIEDPGPIVESNLTG